MTTSTSRPKSNFPHKLVRTKLEQITALPSEALPARTEKATTPENDSQLKTYPVAKVMGRPRTSAEKENCKARVKKPKTILERGDIVKQSK
jgi:hypothetical protein